MGGARGGVDEERVNAEEVGWEGGVGRLRGWGTVERMGRECGLTLMLTDPSTFDSSPRRAESREDFPAPTGPTTARRQPCGTVRFILATQTGVGGTHSWVGPCSKLQTRWTPDTATQEATKRICRVVFPSPNPCLATQAAILLHTHAWEHTCAHTHTHRRDACAHITPRYMHIGMRAHTRAHRNVHTQCAHTQTCSHTCRHMCTNTCMHTRTHVHTEFAAAGGFNQHRLSPRSLQRAPHCSPCFRPRRLPRPVFHSPSSTCQNLSLS